MRGNLLTKLSKATREWIAEQIFHLLRGNYPVFVLLGVSNVVSRSLGSDVRFAFDVTRKLFAAKEKATQVKGELISWGLRSISNFSAQLVRRCGKAREAWGKLLSSRHSVRVARPNCGRWS
jgi:hypothetical protein